MGGTATPIKGRGERAAASALSCERSVGMRPVLSMVEELLPVHIALNPSQGDKAGQQRSPRVYSVARLTDF